MSKYVIDSSTLTSIADAVRAKTGSADPIVVSDIPTAIANLPSGGGDLPEEILKYSSNCDYQFYKGKWNWVINKYGSLIITSNIYTAKYMFTDCWELKSIPFQLNFVQDSSVDCNYLFEGCSELKEIADINGLKARNIDYLFSNCKKIRYIPDFINCDFSGISYYSHVFSYCHSLRSIPELFLNNMYKKDDYEDYTGQFDGCSSLDEIVGLYPQPTTGINGPRTSNMFTYCFDDCSRLKNIIFMTQEDGTPYVCKWKKQVIDLKKYIGYAYYDPDYGCSMDYILDYNSGITTATKVIDDASYQALKNDPDWWTMDVNYSRYNHDSAVATINSLPDTSAYLASAGGTNHISFNGASGTNTDGGAISNLTAEEIAVATAKGWTVTLA